MFRIVAIALAAGSLSVPSAAQDTYKIEAEAPPGFDREQAAETTLYFTQELIRIDSQNPPGNELAVAKFFDQMLREIPGVTTEIIEPVPGRAHFVARLAAVAGSQRPVLIMGHMDVVGAQAENWETPPFEPTIKGDYLYGRGAIDDKGPLAAALTAFLQLAFNRNELNRDVILLATADEEGGTGVGIDWIVENRPELLGNAEFALNEGGRIRIARSRIIQTVNIQTTEKIYYAVRAAATGSSGHASVPLPDNALAALARAVSRVHAWRAPLLLTETSRLYFKQLAQVETDMALKRAMLEISSEDEATGEQAADVLSEVPIHAAVLRAGVSLTMMNGGIRENVIPSSASAMFNVRIVPGQDIAKIVDLMNAVGAEESVTFTLVGEPKIAPPPSPLDSALYKALEQAAKVIAPQATVVPLLSTGATDGAVLRAAGIATYGILPFPLIERDELRMHGDNERVPLAALAWGAEYLYSTLYLVTR